MKAAMKKGQLTVFLILGIILFLVVLIFISYSFVEKTEGVKVDQQIQQQTIQEAAQIKLYSEQCLQRVTEEALQFIGPRGGYQSIPLPLHYGNTSLWVVNQVNVQPTLSQIQEAVEDYIELDVGDCLDYSSFEKQGLNITLGGWESEIVFGRERTTSILHVPLTIGRDNYITEYSTFQTEVMVGFRKMFETASMIVNLQLSPEFDQRNPLRQLNTTLEAAYDSFSDHLVYHLTDHGYQLSFASQLGRSELKKATGVHPNSNIVPTVLPSFISSVDKMATIVVKPGTTMNLNGSAVDLLTVQQQYLTNVSREIPVQELANNSVVYENRTWKLQYPVYNFEPDGLRFNIPPRLILSWDEGNNPHQGKMGILYHAPDGWRPVPCVVNYTAHYAYVDIPGFSGATLVDCARLESQQASTISEIDPGGGCVLKVIVIIVVTIILVIIATVITIVTFGGGSASYGGVGSVVAILYSMLTFSYVNATVLLIVTSAVGIIGGMAINSAIPYDATDDTLSFPVSCEQDIQAMISTSGGAEGECTVLANGEVNVMKTRDRVYRVTPTASDTGPPLEKDDDYDVQAERTYYTNPVSVEKQQVTLQSQTKSCPWYRRMACLPCSVKCSARYR